MTKPHILISTAMSIDGKIGTALRKSLELSSPEDFEAVDKLRSEYDAILVGSTTLTNDDPRLLVKSETYRKERLKNGLPENPLKVAISKDCNIPSDSRFLQSGEKVVFTTKLAKQSDVDRVSKLATVIVSQGERVEPNEIVDFLSKRGIHKLMIEGGGKTNYMFLRAGLVNEMRVSIAPILLGSEKGARIVDGEAFTSNLKLERTEKLGGNVICWYSAR